MHKHEFPLTFSQYETLVAFCRKQKALHLSRKSVGEKALFRTSTYTVIVHLSPDRAGLMFHSTYRNKPAFELYKAVLDEMLSVIGVGS